MATTPATRARAAASAKAAEAAPDVQTKGVSRREFLYYIWGASMALLTAESIGAIVWFSLPRFRAGEFGGEFVIDPTTVPAINAGPAGNPAGKYWLSNTDKGLIALSMVCTHLGCLFKWVPTNNRFECPCHGSKFQANGTYIEGPAPRNLDRFEVTVDGTGTKSTATGTLDDAVSIDGATAIRINTGKKIKGQTHA